MRNRICALIIALATSIRCAGSQLGPAWQSLAEDARKLGQQGFYAEAMPLYRAALEEAERLTAPPFQVLPLLRGLALAYHELGKDDEAESCHRRALALSEQTTGAEQWVSSELDSLAHLAHLRGNDGEAEPLAKRAVAVLEKDPVSGGVQLARSLGLLGKIYADQGRIR